MTREYAHGCTFLMLATSAREAHGLCLLADKLMQRAAVQVQLLPERGRLDCAIAAYASARADGAQVALIGAGDGCAAALMLSGAYPTVLLSLILPAFDMRMRSGALGTPAKRRLFSVVAPTQVFAADASDASMRRDVRTVLQGVSSDSCELIVLPGTADAMFAPENLATISSKIVDGLALIMTQTRLFSDTICV